MKTSDRHDSVLEAATSPTERPWYSSEAMPDLRLLVGVPGKGVDHTKRVSISGEDTTQMD